MAVGSGLGVKFALSWVGLRVEVCSAEHARSGDTINKMKSKLTIRLKGCFNEILLG